MTSGSSGHAIEVRSASVDDVKRYREDLVAQARQPSTIAQELNVLRRVYAADGGAGLRAHNPAIGIRAPRDRRASVIGGEIAADHTMRRLWSTLPRPPASRAGMLLR